jgi:hypothetical protein
LLNATRFFFHGDPAVSASWNDQIHELIDGRSDPEIYTSKFAFRLLYNGKILTPLVAGCHEHCELCDIKHLKSKVDPIATRDADCSAPPDGGPSAPTPTGVNTQQFFIALDTPTGTAIFVGLVILSGFLGCLITYHCMIRRRSKGGRNAVVGSGDDWEIDYSDGDLDLQEGGFHDEPNGGIGFTGNGGSGHY